MDEPLSTANLYSIEAEQAVLGCILLEGELIKETSLTPEKFYERNHKNIFWAMQELDRKGSAVDHVTVTTLLEKHMDKLGGVSYLVEIIQATPNTTSFKHYEHIVLSKWKVREAISIFMEGQNSVMDSQDSFVISDVVQKLMKIEQEEEDDEYDRAQSLYELNEELEHAKPGIAGIATGYKELDSMTNGFQEGDLIVVGARPSLGKTAFCLNVALNACQVSKDTISAIFSLEMGTRSLEKRLLSIAGNIDGVKIRDPKTLFTQEDIRSKNAAIGLLSTLDYRIYDKAGATIPYIWSKLRKIRYNNPDKKILAIIDYLQLIKGNPKLAGNRTLEIGEISRSLKLMARELSVSVVALSQLSRGVESRQDKRPMMSDLRESGNIEQDADLIAFLYRDDYYDKETEKKNIIEIIIAKQRNGPIGKVELAFLKEYGKFLELERRREE